MGEIFIKKYWIERDVMFYLHSKNGKIVRQAEITPISKILLTLDCPIKGDSMLYDQSLDELEVKESDFITEEEFNEIWNNSK
ncbi:hypothetical protein H4K35_11250 [Myroides sp. NP-2]|uniref:hypothetical protein n=1 Tax=Myroides sp. NP-2 TaxID=2759945 RepID=UPI0015FA94CE|nr:hypothetical protein [Myroides sp. NP-2]MBB1150682.1 hypothetical protein [Myroides sp. NP-2]